MKIKFKLDDYSRPIWETILKAKEEVASWPAWKRGEQAPTAAQRGEKK